jgi:hypothetical protein
MFLYFLLALFIYGLYRLLQFGKSESGLPPGPPTVPIFGNMLQMPATQTEWQYVITKPLSFAKP